MAKQLITSWFVVSVKGIHEKNVECMFVFFNKPVVSNRGFVLDQVKY